MVEVLNDLKKIPGPKILHILTTKGKGYELAEKDQTKWHAPGLFNKNTGEIIKFRISNSEEATVKIPDNMLQESEDGPPEANKALVGKLFMLSSIEGVITEIELEEDYDYE